MLLRADDICVRFAEDVVLDRVAIQVASGETTAVLGLNGAGKSVLGG